MSKFLISKVSWVSTRGLVGQYVTVVFCDVAQCPCATIIQRCLAMCSQVLRATLVLWAPDTVIALIAL